ncbi:MAG TPA: radical SAM protein [Balneolales bacterium]|nr:radical SAM protein [Balneolales bacterium]
MILFYNPPSSADKKPVMPLALLALGAILEGLYEYQIIDGNLVDDPVGYISNLIQTQGVDILGVTVMGGPQLENAVPVCRVLKILHPEINIVWGGYFPTQHYDVCLRAGYVDYVIRGHGEYAFRDLITGIRNGRDLLRNPIDGVAFREPASQAIVKSNVTTVPHPGELPSFPYHRIDMSGYPRKTYLGRRTLSHHSSYGCPFYCNFCAVVNMVNGRWKAQSARRTADTVRHLVSKYGADGIEFFDNNFFVNEGRTAEFSDRIKRLGINWWGEARIDTMMKYSDSTWQKMRRSGLKMVFLGAESGSDETLQRMNKGGKASTTKTLELAGRMRNYGIIPEYSFVMGNPPEPEKDIEDTIRFIRKVKQVNPETEIIMYMYTPVPLSGELFDQAKANGFTFPETLEEWVSPVWKDFAQRRSHNLPWIGDPLRRRVHNFERVLNAYYPTVTDTRLQGWIKKILQLTGGLRYHLNYYSYPMELRVMQRLIHYQRPETSGF